MSPRDRPSSGWSLRWARAPRAVDPERAFEEIFDASDHAFWLDSSLVEEGRSRFSFLGDGGGPDGEVLSCRVGTGAVEARSGSHPPTVIVGSIFEVLRRRLSERAITPPPELPFDLDCGYVGYLGYEAKADCGSPNRHVSPLPDAVWIAATRIVAIDHLRGDTWVVVLCGPDPLSERAGEAWLARTRARLDRIPGDGGSAFGDGGSALLEGGGSIPGGGGSTLGGGGSTLGGGGSTIGGGDGQPGVADRTGAMARTMVGAGRPPLDRRSSEAPDQPPRDLGLEAALVRSRARYLADIARCQELLRAGDSYQICLTNAIDLPFRGDPLELYRGQRLVNPAPYAAYLRLPDVAVLCSSPERFLKIDRDRLVEARPIKGTAARHADRRADDRAARELLASAKDRAENVTIVDLVRNDLGRICEIGTVSAPSLMALESYATVHQLVSTVRGRLREDVDAVEAVRACFPGGSMTGAPKLRTMEIIDSLETRARGVYAGAIGYFGLGGGADLNIVIRTIVVADGRLSVGAGGAIVVDSDPEEELREMLVKARAPLRALALTRS